MVSRLIRRYQQPLLIVFTILIIISFVGFFNGGFLTKGVGNHAATIYGRPVTQVEMQRQGRKFELARDLGMRELLETLAGRAQSMDEAIENFTWNDLVLRHEADQLGVATTEEEVAVAIQAMPVFQTNGAFDSGKYALIFDRAFQPRGFGKDQLEDLVREQLRMRKVKTLLGSTTAVAPSQLRAVYNEQQQKFESSVIRLPLADFLATATAPEEDLQKLFESRKAQLKSEEMRTVRLAAFVLPTTDKPLEGRERAEALAKLGTSAEEFSIAMTEKDADFTAAATKVGANAEQTPEFTRFAPPPALAAAPAVVAAAFKLTAKEPNSDVVTTERGYYVLQLAGITEARPLTLEEAKPQLTEQLKRERAQEALTLKGGEVRTKIEAALKEGKSFADAATAAGVKAETFPVFSRTEPARDQPDASEIMTTATELKAGQLSAFVPTATGGVLVQVDKLPPIDDAKFATDKTLIADSFLRFTSDALFAEWLKLRRAEARIPTRRG